MPDGANPAPAGSSASSTDGPAAEGATGAGPSAPAPAAVLAPPLASARVEFDVAPAAILKVGGALLACWLAARVWPVVVLLLLSLMLVATFNPFVRRLQARIDRVWALTAVILGVVVSGAGLVVMVIPPLVRQAGNVLQYFPRYAAATQTAAARFGIRLNIEALMAAWPQRVSQFGPEMVGMLTTVLSGITGVLTVAVLTIYLLIEGPRVGMALMRLLPREERLPARRMLEEIAVQVGSYMRGQLLTSGLAGLFTYLLLLGFGVREPLALAVWMAAADAVPMVGLLIGTIPAVLMALPRGMPVALAVLAGTLIYHLIESHIIVPRVYGTTMKLPATVILIAILIGATLMGILGALLALPVAAAIPVMLRFVAEWRERQSETENDAAAALP
jgi:predicted PurR-regulated permease PerM